MHSILLALGFDVVVMLACYLYCQSSQRAGLVDAAWAFCIAMTAISAAMLHVQGDELVRWLIGGVSGLWFARLSWHLARRYAQEKQEDSRYAAMREALGKKQSVGFLVFFMAQALMALLFSVPMLMLTAEPVAAWSGNYEIYLWIALVIAIVAFVGEYISDQQLHDFKQDSANKGKTMRSGLWRYSRHPNYFFEWVHWFAYPIAGIGAGLDYLWIYPVLMFGFLYYFTGIPFNEKQSLRNRGEDYRKYQAQTSMFFPWIPKK